MPAGQSRGTGDHRCRVKHRSKTILPGDSRWDRLLAIILQRKNRPSSLPCPVSWPLHLRVPKAVVILGEAWLATVQLDVTDVQVRTALIATPSTIIVLLAYLLANTDHAHSLDTVRLHLAYSLGWRWWSFRFRRLPFGRSVQLTDLKTGWALHSR